MSARAISSRAILRAIGCDKLDLVRVTGHGYWYFQYDDEAAGIYETASVMCVRLNDMALEHWVSDGRELVARVAAMQGGAA